MRKIETYYTHPYGTVRRYCEHLYTWGHEARVFEEGEDRFCVCCDRMVQTYTVPLLELKWGVVRFCLYCEQMIFKARRLGSLAPRSLPVDIEYEDSGIDKAFIAVTCKEQPYVLWHCGERMNCYSVKHELFTTEEIHECKVCKQERLIEFPRSDAA